MNDMTMREHLMIVALLPDFVLGKLDDATLRRVSRHLEVCSTCRGESANAMNVLGLLAAVPPPPAWLRSAILRRVIAEVPAAGRKNARHTRILTDQNAAWKPLSDEDRRYGMPFGRPVPRWALTMASAAVLLVGGLVGWTYEQRNGIILEDRIYAMVNDASTAHPLEDSDLPVSATGVVFAEPTGREVYLVANSMPVLPSDQRYQVWLFTIDDEQVSAGLVPVGANGEVRALLETPAPFASYVGVALTVEPKSGSPTPTSEMVLGGAFPATSAGAARILPVEASA